MIQLPHTLVSERVVSHFFVVVNIIGQVHVHFSHHTNTHPADCKLRVGTTPGQAASPAVHGPVRGGVGCRGKGVSANVVKG